MQVLVDGLMTYYERTGKGRTVVLLHGWGDSSASFRRLMKFLSGGFDVVAVDLPGFGKTSDPQTAWDLSDYADFVRQFLAKVGLSEPYALVGHSHGGAVAVRTVGQKKIVPKKLVLLAGSGIRGERTGRLGAVRLAAKAGKVVVAPLPNRVKSRLRRKLYKSVGSDMLVVPEMEATFRKIITDDVQADATHIKIPVLLLYGENDTETPPRYGERYHELLPHSQFEIVPAAGHFLLHDQPAKTERAITEFLQ
jgi:pimeloyl-ACP methyl ester carboxylesterase